MSNILDYKNGGGLLGDFEAKYEEYKNNILKDHWLRNKLCEKYHDSIRMEGEYVGENGVLWKIGALSIISGICLSLFWSMEDRGDTQSRIVCIVASIIMIAALLLAAYVAHKFKECLGQRNFYKHIYYQHFKEYVQAEKSKEKNAIMYDMWENRESMLWRLDSLDNMSKEELKSLISRYIAQEGALQRRYDDLDRYDRFASELKTDYFFNAEIQKNIDKYI